MTWHYDTEMNAYSRHPRPSHIDLCYGFDTCEELALDDAQYRRYGAVHEAGHAAMFLRFGITFETITVGMDDRIGGAVTRRPGPADAGAMLIALAAGERANDRWLRDCGLWTPARAWLAEDGARNDRHQIERIIRYDLRAGLTFGARSDPYRDLAALHDLTDRHLAAAWPAVLRLAEAVDARGQLTYGQVRELLGAVPLGR